MKLRIFKTLLLALLLFLTATSSSTAQIPQTDRDPTLYDLSVSPPTAYLKIHPGNSAVHTITLKNNGQAELVVQPQLVDFSADGKTGQPVLSMTSTFPYIDQDKTSFDSVGLKPGATAQLTLHFSVPATAEDREYPLSVLFKGSSPEEASTDSSLSPVAGIIASNVIVLVSRAEFLENRFTVDSFNSPAFIDSFAELATSPIVKNNSYAAAVASGSATITDWKGTKVAQFDVSPSVILGYSSKQIQPLSTTEESSPAQFSYDSPFLIGPYTVSIFLPSGNPDNLTYIEHKKIVWAIPFSIIVAVTLASVCLVIYNSYKKKNAFYTT